MTDCSTLIPDIDDIKGTLVEIHGSPDSGKTKSVLRYIKKMQDKHNILTCYVDAANSLKKYIANIESDRVWMLFGLNSQDEIEAVYNSIRLTDLVVIDDITFCDADNVGQFIKQLDRSAHINNTAVIILNQKRFVLNYTSGQYEEKPYRYNKIGKYCSMVIDIDEGVFIKRDERLQIDSFAQYLVNA